ncbi:unnamed protein product [Brachionus calyciflorus]|uniref:Major facilitator superfamily (MFS) profile domain-containing protein n=1 Tax=Brachionus calyciflorus TaxID=104777 RepID=A0A814HE91_9BILA|nr:unnamed protein product [Brachionus calyciflorus]
MDNLIEIAGDFGRFQYKAILIVGLISALSSACIYATIFIAAEPELICQKITSSSERNIIPKIKNSNFSYDEKCSIWSEVQRNQSSDMECFFDKSLYDTSIITDWNLICEKQFMAGLTQTIHILGSIFGFFGGIFGDRYGRKRAVIIFSFLLTTCLLFSQLFLEEYFNLSFESKYIIFSVSQFLIGLLVNCLYCTAYVLLMELTTDKYTTSISNLNSYIYIIGEIIVLVIYYYTRNWQILNWLIGLFSFIIFLLTLTLRESPTWLISTNQNQKAFEILEEIAKQNGKPKISMTLIETVNLEEKLLGDKNNLKLKNDENFIKNEFYQDFLVLKEIFFPKSTLIKTCLLFYIWLALMLLYYGISLGVTSVDLVDPYLMYLLSAFAEFIGYVICYINDIFGRKKTMFSFFLITTLMYSGIALISENIGENDSSYSWKAITLMILALIGKCVVSGCYHIAYIYTAELYPTNTRNTAVLFLTCFGGLSSLIAPQINILKTVVWNPLPYIIYSISALLGCICLLYLPETHKLSLKQ